MNSIILSEKMSLKYFGDENPVGQNILVKFDENRSKEFKISGVGDAFPKAHTIDFDFLINFESFRLSEPGYNFHDWSKFVNATLIQVENPVDLKVIAQKMDKYRILQNDAPHEDWNIKSFAFEPLSKLHERSGEIVDDISRSSESNYESVVYLSVIGLFMLALACFNYINIAIVSAAGRLKEIGVRKTIGARRGAIMIQFLAENIQVTFAALILGLIAGATIFIPGLEQLNHFSMGFSLADKNLWIYLPSILLLTSAASGIYPALYIAKFEVITILKGSVQFGRKNPLAKIFLGLQLVMACIFITSAVMFTQNTSYLAQRSWGCNQQNALYADVPDLTSFDQLSAVVGRDPNILSLSGSSQQLGKSNTTSVVHMPDRQYGVDQLSVEPNYFETMGLKLKQGSFFLEHYQSDKRAVVVNEFFAKSLALKRPTGQRFKIDSIEYEIVGVVGDFQQYNFFTKIRPTIFKVADREDYRYLSMKVRPGAEKQTYKSLQKQWSGLFPEIPFQGGHQEDVWGGYYEEIAVHARVWQVVASIAVLLAGLGLYGLITLNVAGRVREFSIRKVPGAGVENIIGVISRQYVVLFTIALVVGAPLSYMLMKILFDAAYKYHAPVSYSSVFISTTVLIQVLLITVSTQIRKVLKANPVKGLKTE